MENHKHAFIKEAIYDYDRSRKIKARCECGAKTFSWQRMLQPGVYVKGRGNQEPGLYMGTGSGDRLWIVEGEKDVETLACFGELAVSPPDGAGSWKDEYTEELSVYGGVPILLVADDDSAGHAHAKDVRESFRRVLGISVTRYEPSHGKDITEYLDGGGTLPRMEKSVALHSITDGLDIGQCRTRPDDPIYHGGYAGPTNWLPAATVMPSDDGTDTVVTQEAPPGPYDVRVRCGQCRNYLMVSLDDGKTRKCWVCRTRVETDDGVKYIPLVYRMEDA